MVEVGGIEPPSESTLTGSSPGADGYCGGLSPPVPLPDGKPSRRSGQVRVMMRGQVNSFPPHGRHINDAFPGLWPLRFRRLPLIRQQQQQCCCYLIYKLPVLWRSGAAARWSGLHTPVETLTPPCRRGENRPSLLCPSSCHENRYAGFSRRPRCWDGARIASFGHRRRPSSFLIKKGPVSPCAIPPLTEARYGKSGKRETCAGVVLWMASCGYHLSIA